MSQSNHTAKTGRPLSVDEVVASLGVYPLEAFDFVQRGLHYTASRVHGSGKSEKASRHVSGQQLAEGLREFAQMQWGLMARAVLARWQITSTYDFGRIVFALIEGGVLQKTDEDNLEDFRNVFDFALLNTTYRIESKV
jgi:uncharacterized repeat protein (TIGR04138 family)